jgi:hypothetical protein
MGIRNMSRKPPVTASNISVKTVHAIVNPIHAIVKKIDCHA